MEYLGAWGTLIHEKNLKSKISCQTPFNVGNFPPFINLKTEKVSVGTSYTDKQEAKKLEKKNLIVFWVLKKKPRKIRIRNTEGYLPQCPPIRIRPV